jgi:DNA-3-methyladenine glycosylase II
MAENTRIILSQSAWKSGVSVLGHADPVLRAIIQRYPNERMHTHPNALKTLLRAIIGQQISIAAASAIWRAIESQAGPITPANLQPMAYAKWRDYGLSDAKAKTVARVLAYTDGRADTYFHQTPYATIESELLAIKGIGPWTVAMFQIFHLGHSNVLPLTDLGLLNAVRTDYPLAKHTHADVRTWLHAHACCWEPYCTLAVWYLWRSIDPHVVVY